MRNRAFVDDNQSYQRIATTGLVTNNLQRRAFINLEIIHVHSLVTGLQTLGSQIFYFYYPKTLSFLYFSSFY